MSTQLRDFTPARRTDAPTIAPGRSTKPSGSVSAQRLCRRLQTVCENRVHRQRHGSTVIDVRRYAKLRSDLLGMDITQGRLALAKSQQSDAPEIEPLRDVADNDVMREAGQDAATVPLTRQQRLLALLA